MQIVKYTKEKYKRQALREGTIQIGSTLYYRNIENKKLKDTDEGFGTTTIRNINTILTAEDLNRLFPDEEFKWKKDSEWTIDMQGKGGLVSAKKPFNCFVYCCSVVKSSIERYKIKNRFNYETFFIIKDRKRFCNHVGEKLKQYLIQHYKNHPELWDFTIDITKIMVIVKHQQVQYDDRPKNKDIYDSDLKTYKAREITIENLEQIFIKKKSFSGEKEYRFAWFILIPDPENPNRFLAPNPRGINTIVLKIDPRNFIS